MDIETLTTFVMRQLDNGRAGVREVSTIVFDYQGEEHTLRIESHTGLFPGKVILKSPTKELKLNSTEISISHGEAFMKLYNKARTIWLDSESKKFFEKKNG